MKVFVHILALCDLYDDFFWTYSGLMRDYILKGSLTQKVIYSPLCHLST